MNNSIMNGKLHGKSFLKLTDFSKDDLTYLLDLSSVLKEEKRANISHRLHEGKNIALIFEKISTTVRCAFEVAASDLGISTVCLDSFLSQIGDNENPEDSAKVIGRMFDGIAYSNIEHNKTEMFANYSGIPVWNGLTNESNPVQVLADFITIKENLGNLEGVKLVYIGDSRCGIVNSLIEGCSIMGINFVMCSPKNYFPNKALVKKYTDICKDSGGSISLESDICTAVKNAGVIYTDSWFSIDESDYIQKKKIKDLLAYRVTQQVLKQASDCCLFMQSLPSFHNLNTAIGSGISEKHCIDCIEVTEEVFNSSASVVFDEAENLMHAAKAVMAATL